MWHTVCYSSDRSGILASAMFICSERGYLEQIVVYKEFQGKQPLQTG